MLNHRLHAKHSVGVCSYVLALAEYALLLTVRRYVAGQLKKNGRTSEKENGRTSSKKQIVGRTNTNFFSM